DGIVDAQSQQAVNGSQLFNTNQKVDKNTADIAKNTGDITNLTGDITNITNGKAGILQLSPDGSALVISDKAKSATQVQLGDRTLDGVKDGIVDAQSQQAVNGSQLFNTNQKVDKNTADIAKNTGDINHLSISVNKNAGDITNLANTINNGKTGLLQISDDGTTLVISDRAESATQVNLGNRLITGVENGALTQNSKDAVNGSQLYEKDQKIKRNTHKIEQNQRAVQTNTNEIRKISSELIVQGGKVEKIGSDLYSLEQGKRGVLQINTKSTIKAPEASGENSLAAGAGSRASNTDTVAIGNGSNASEKNSVAIGNNSTTYKQNTISVGREGDERTISNVARGTEKTDAVNLSQLNETFESIQSEIYSGYAKLNKYISKVDKSTRAGIAGVTAIANVPQVINSGQTSIGLGIGNYRGESAIAVGLSKSTDSGNLIFKGSFSIDTQNKGAVGAGISYLVD
ncbi:YadA family autotransporter adhesin, partial [Pseudomonas aeruginosa]|nr:YadA-like family protein [Pseudomonas aeruginosa]